MALEPFFAHKALLLSLFAAYGLYEAICLVAWWRSLPPLARKIACLKLLSARAGKLWKELAAVALLSAVAGLLIAAQWRWL